MNAGERCLRDHRCDHLDRVVADHAHVGKTELADALQQAADARTMHFDPEEIVAADAPRDRGCGFAHAEADLENRGRAPREKPRRSRALDGVEGNPERGKSSSSARCCAGDMRP